MDTKFTGMVEKKTKIDIIKGVGIQSLYDSRLIFNGQATGKRYEWVAAGSIVQVDEVDAPHLLAIRLGGQDCCGGGNPDGNKVFQLAT